MITEFELVSSFGTDSGLTLVGDTLFGTARDRLTPDGIIFSVSTSGDNFRVIHEFAEPTMGRWPTGKLEHYNGRLYGATTIGGFANSGTVFSFGLAEEDFDVLHEFGGFPDDGNRPGAGVTISNGILYGTAAEGGNSNRGIVYSLVVPEPSTTFPSLLVIVAGCCFGLDPYRRSGTQPNVA